MYSHRFLRLLLLGGASSRIEKSGSGEEVAGVLRSGEGALEHRQLETVEYLVTAKMLPDGMTKKMSVGPLISYMGSGCLDLKAVKRQAKNLLDRKASHQRPEGSYPGESSLITRAVASSSSAADEELGWNAGAIPVRGN